jgi:hypothetical protein
MSRQLEAHHDPETLGPDFAAVLVIHRAAPGLSVVELCARARLPGPARRAVEHARGCSACRVGALCPDGATLAARIQPRRKLGRSA